ncbi:hypothetical protein [Halococcus hamelinensis]|uniref:Uncharacterized protein n=1 Tax=Halococcus hamelinensis 100A6 TaxID=1132509 RepID=M0M8H1_9EURY|nr:hypothetical protein [Halococcus hamelinensis]EMA42016.1 hypothetical protein C447_00460 [Halococcus hamelinensis 100A6]
MLGILDRLSLEPLYLWVGLVLGVGGAGILYGVLFLRGAGSLAVGACLLVGGALNILLAVREGLSRVPDELGLREWATIAVSAVVSIGVAVGLVFGA